MSESDLFLGGDVQVLQAGVQQQVLVDLGDVARRPAVHLGMIRQVDLQHLQEKKNKNIKTALRRVWAGIRLHEPPHHGMRRQKKKKKLNRASRWKTCAKSTQVN